MRVVIHFQVRANLVVVSLIRIEQMAKMPFAEDNHVIEAVPLDWNRSASPRVHFAKATAQKCRRAN
jgi:hypothetical protein